jgi:hypothetical protein
LDFGGPFQGCHSLAVLPLKDLRTYDVGLKYHKNPKKDQKVPKITTKAMNNDTKHATVNVNAM